MKKIYAITFLTFWVLCSAAQTVLDTGTPQRIILNLTETPATSMAFTWRTVGEFPNSGVEFNTATDGTGFAKAAKRIKAKSEKLDLGNNRAAYYYSAVLDGLQPNTVHAYRVGHDSVWSEWNQFRTADSSVARFTFVFFGDPQNDIREFVSRPFREAFRMVPDARFWLFSGDLTSEPEDRLWEEWFQAAGFIHSMLPSIMAPGNHDYQSVRVSGRSERTKTLPLWRPQFTFPENGVAGLEETSYYVDYQGVRFVMLNSNEKLAEQAAWLDTLLSKNPNTWTIVSFHHPLYSTGRARDNRDTRNAFLPIFDKHHVDLVLQGHDHTYGRSHKLYQGRIVSVSEKGTVYIVSSCGPKFYPLNPLYRDLMAKMGEGLQLFQVITIDGSKLQCKTYTALGSIFDSFVLEK